MLRITAPGTPFFGNGDRLIDAFNLRITSNQSFFSFVIGTYLDISFIILTSITAGIASPVKITKFRNLGSGFLTGICGRESTA
jgi:hypothetical protein